MEIGSSLCAQRSGFNLNLHRNAYSFPTSEDISNKFVELHSFASSESSVQQVNNKSTKFIDIPFTKLEQEDKMLISMSQTPKFDSTSQPTDCCSETSKKNRQCIISGYIGSKCQSYRSDLGNSVIDSVCKFKFPVLYQSNVNPQTLKLNKLSMSSPSTPIASAVMSPDIMSIIYKNKCNNLGQSQKENKEISLEATLSNNSSFSCEMHPERNFNVSDTKVSMSNNMGDKLVVDESSTISTAVVCGETVDKKAVNKASRNKKRNQRKRRAERRKRMLAAQGKSSFEEKCKNSGDVSLNPYLRLLPDQGNEGCNVVGDASQEKDGSCIISSCEILEKVACLQETESEYFEDLGKKQNEEKMSPECKKNMNLTENELRSPQMLTNSCSEEDEATQDSLDILTNEQDLNSLGKLEVKQEFNPKVMVSHSPPKKMPLRQESKELDRKENETPACPVIQLVKTCSNKAINAIMGYDSSDVSDDQEEVDYSDWSDDEKEVNTNDCQELWENLQNEFSFELPRTFLQSDSSQKHLPPATTAKKQPVILEQPDEDCVDNRVPGVWDVVPRGPTVLNFSSQQSPEKQDFGILNINLKFHNRTPEGLKSINERWNKSVENCSPNYSSATIRKVQFSDVEPEVCWVTPDNEDRKGSWEELARDAERFKCRVRSVGAVLAPMLDPVHRERVWRARFCDDN